MSCKLYTILITKSLFGLHGLLKKIKKINCGAGVHQEAFKASASIEPEAYLFNCTDPNAITERFKN